MIICVSENLLMQTTFEYTDDTIHRMMLIWITFTMVIFTSAQIEFWRYHRVEITSYTVVHYRAKWYLWTNLICRTKAPIT